MADEKEYPHEIAIRETVGEFSKLPKEIRQKINGFNITKLRSKNPDDVMKMSYALADEIYNFDENDLPEPNPEESTMETTDPNNKEGASDGSADDSNTQTPQSKEGQTDTNTPAEGTDPPPAEEPEFIDETYNGPFMRKMTRKVPNPNYKPKQ